MTVLDNGRPQYPVQPADAGRAKSAHAGPIARVIVDVPAKDTNREFDYRVPPELVPLTEIGSRVEVPFGRRVLQGFVTDIRDTSDLDPDKLKPIADVLDVVPPLTPELVRLGKWMGESLVCPDTIALQAMVPGALKAKYERMLTVAPSVMRETENGQDQGKASGRGHGQIHGQKRGLERGQMSGQMHGQVRGQEQEYGQIHGHEQVRGQMHGQLQGPGGPPDDAKQALDGTGQAIVEYVKARGSASVRSVLDRFPGEADRVKRLVKLGVLLERQTVQDRLKPKKLLYVFPPEDPASIASWIAELPATASRQKEVLAHLRDHPEPVALAELTARLNVGSGTVKALADKGYLSIREREVLRDPYEGRRFAPLPVPELTDEQTAACAAVCYWLDRGAHARFLLHGVTGSGKTEVYLQTIARCLELGREAIVLVPEISLTPQMVDRFKGRFGDRVAVLHSRLSQGERYDEWRKIHRGQVSVAVGARSAIFAPFTKLGLIIIDEEHESSYKQEESPKYHARDVAARRAREHGAVLVLGSATPSLESYHLATLPADKGFFEGRELSLIRMPNRVGGRPLPAVHLVDMRKELEEGNRSMFSRMLQEGIRTRLERGEQMVLLLNRRGYATFVLCRSCGYAAGCPHCDISLTYHQKSGVLRCHYCGYAEREATICPACGSAHIRHFGTGTQRVEEELIRHFPGIRVIRMDQDTTSGKGSHEKWLNQFRERKADVLLGTQMVAKGLDFPAVTLVGVLAADSILHLPDFRAVEKTFQLVTQVAGRAGRHALPGEVIVQTYNPDHYAMQAAAAHDFEGFAGRELQLRKERGYPPFARLALITLSHPSRPALMRTGERLAREIRGRWREVAGERGIDPSLLDVYGPTASPIPRLKDRYRIQCMVKYRHDLPVPGMIREALDRLRDELPADGENVQISVDIDPQNMM